MHARPESFINATEKSNDSQVSSSSLKAERIFLPLCQSFTKSAGIVKLSDGNSLEIKLLLRLLSKSSFLTGLMIYTSKFVHFKRSFWVMGNVCYKKAGGIAKNLHNLPFF